MDIIINMLLHSFILFCFLTIFYFFYIAPLIEGHVNIELEKSIENGVWLALQNAPNKNLLNSVSYKLRDKYQGSDVYKTEYNRILTRNTYIFMVVYLLTIIAVYCIFKFFDKPINMKFILLENILLFLIIGVIEYMFFIYVAYNYAVLYPSDLKNLVMERIRYNLNK